MRDKLCRVLNECTIAFRKGEPELLRSFAGEAFMAHTYALTPPDCETPRTWEMIDCVLMVIGVDRKRAEANRDRFTALLCDWPEIADQLSACPSYKVIGGTLGDTVLALRLFALGYVLGLWELILPDRYGMTGKVALAAAGLGMILAQPK